MKPTKQTHAIVQTLLNQLDQTMLDGVLNGQWTTDPVETEAFQTAYRTAFEALAALANVYLEANQQTKPGGES